MSGRIRISLQSMADSLIDPLLLKTLIGGTSVLDIPRLTIADRAEAEAFLRAYGYDVTDDGDMARLWSYHRRAVSYIQTQLVRPGEILPPELAEEVLLREPAQLLVYASDLDNMERQRWACAILRIMHVLAHLSNDLFTVFSDEIDRDEFFKSGCDSIMTKEEFKRVINNILVM